MTLEQLQEVFAREYPERQASADAGDLPNQLFRNAWMQGFCAANRHHMRLELLGAQTRARMCADPIGTAVAVERLAEDLRF